MSPTDPPQNIYAPPQNPEPAPPPPKPSALGKWLAIIGACMYFLSPIACIWIAISLTNAFAGQGAQGIGDPAQLSKIIDDVLVASVVCLVLGLLGPVLLLVSLVGFRYRAVWLFWFLIITSILSLPAFPVGTIMGIVILIYSITHRNEFLPPPAPVSPPQSPT